MLTTAEISPEPKVFTLEDYMLNPPEKTEWVDGELVEKNGSTAKHGRTQSRLSYYLGNYINSSLTVRSFVRELEELDSRNPLWEADSFS